VPKQPSGPVGKKDDLDLTPPEEIRARRIKRFVLLGALVACVLGVAIYFGARPVGGAIKGWQSRRLAREAFALIEQGKWSDANAKARDAYLLCPTEPEAWRAIARLASRTNQWPPALEWWKNVDEAHRLTVEDRRDYIATALAAGEVTLAAKQVQVLMAQPAPAAIDLMWAGQLASRQSDPALALDYAERVLADKRAKPYEIASAATLVLSLTSPSSQRYAEAWKQIEDVARDPKNPASLGALVLLANEKTVPPMSPIGGNTSLSLESLGRRSLGEDGTPAPSPTPATEGAASAEATAAGAAVSSEQSNPSPNQGAAASSPPPEISLDSTPQPTPATQSGDTVALDLVAKDFSDGHSPNNGGPTKTARALAICLSLSWSCANRVRFRLLPFGSGPCPACWGPASGDRCFHAVGGGDDGRAHKCKSWPLGPAGSDGRRYRKRAAVVFV